MQRTRPRMLVVVGLIAVACLGLAGGAAAGNLPDSFSDAGRLAENVYEYARDNNWASAIAESSALTQSIAAVRSTVDDSDSKVSLKGHELALERAVNDRDRSAAMREANQITLAVADLAPASELKRPVQLLKLAYYARELEIWSDAADAARLEATVAQMRNEWEALRPAVDTRSAVEGQRVGDLLAQGDAARTPADYAALSRAVKEEVNTLKGLFPLR